MEWTRKAVLLMALSLAIVFVFGNDILKDTLQSKTEKKDNSKGSLFQPMVIFYESGIFEPGEDDYKRIEKFISDIKNKPSLSFVISAYTDPQGSNGYNQHLSELRAEGVKKILLGNGIPESGIMTKAYGESKSGELELSQYSKMRKVEILPVIMMK
jgi:outer membrane protein OmpA-like peptidoglycan-associated protein